MMIGPTKLDVIHKPVLIREVRRAFNLDNLALLKKALRDVPRYIDATLGLGGHSLEIVKSGGFVLGIDDDEAMLEVAKIRLEKACSALNRKNEECFNLVQGNFRKIEEISGSLGHDLFLGIIFDLGVSTPQLTSDTRGFSFANPDAALDMRLSPKTQSVAASDLLNSLRSDQLEEMFGKVLDRKHSQRLAKRIIDYRSLRKIEKVGDFLGIIKGDSIKKELHPATLPFLALRIATNTELANLQETLPKAFSLLKKGGRLAVISFHSGEDRIVKSFFKSIKSQAIIISKSPIRPQADEIKDNPRARSAKMRVLERL